MKRGRFAEVGEVRRPAGDQVVPDDHRVPRASRASVRCEPMNPAPPATKIRTVRSSSHHRTQLEEQDFSVLMLPTGRPQSSVLRMRHGMAASRELERPDRGGRIRGTCGNGA